MPTNPHLNDTPLILLSGVLQRDDGYLPAPIREAGRGAPAVKAAAGLVRRKLVEKLPVADAALAWSGSGDALSYRRGPYHHRSRAARWRQPNRRSPSPLEPAPLSTKTP